MNVQVKQLLFKFPAITRFPLILTSNCGIRNFRMSAGVNRDHIDVTKDQPRSPGIHEANVIDVSTLSPTVKALQLKVLPSNGQDFHFQPGQWVDMFIPGIDTVGGFSITSTPSELSKTGEISLAIKLSTWPPAQWIHTQCSVGSTVTLRSGGDFYLPEAPSGDMVFVAGGVGINPIASMIFHLADIRYTGKITLLYTAKTVQELIFKERFEQQKSFRPNLDTHYFVTGNEAVEAEGIKPKRRRISEEDLLMNVSSEKLVYVCGPPPLIQLVTGCRDRCKNVIFEKWWI